MRKINDLLHQFILMGFTEVIMAVHRLISKAENKLRHGWDIVSDKSCFVSNPVISVPCLLLKATKVKQSMFY